ncbi:MAG: hypothetical protein ACI8QG_001846 [Flavobacteriales bacterium]|jgi:hypothetical protein
MKRCCLLTILALSGCANEELPSSPLPYLSETNLNDFNFSQPIDYMKQRLVYFMGAEANPHDYTIVTEYGPLSKVNLNETQSLFLSQTVSLGDLGIGCMPASCIYYFVMVDGCSVFIIDNELDLMALISNVHSPAELHIVLFSK